MTSPPRPVDRQVPPRCLAQCDDLAQRQGRTEANPSRPTVGARSRGQRLACGASNRSSIHQRGASPQNDAACPQVNTPGAPERTQEEIGASQSGTAQQQGQQDLQGYHRVSLTHALSGATGAPAPPAIPLEAPCIIINASGGEFRMVLHSDTGETRYGARCLTIVFGQNRNSSSAIGLGNPCEAGAHHYTTSDARLLLARGAECVTKVWWVLISVDTGWVHVGTGDKPCAKRAVLGARFEARRHLEWSHVSFSNWKERVDLAYRFVHGVDNPIQNAKPKFDRFGALKRFEGLTLVSHHGPNHVLHGVMRAMQGLLRSNPLLAPHFALLPTPSFHVTCMDLLSFDQKRIEAHGYDGWGGHGTPPSINEQLAGVSKAVNQCWALLPETLTFRPMMGCHHGNGIKLEADAQTDAALREWRMAIGSHAQRLAAARRRRRRLSWPAPPP